MLRELYDFETDHELECCLTCEGEGGWDLSSDCEVYDEWMDCPDCQGSGDRDSGEVFSARRDAWTAND